MIDRDLEETLDLARVEVHREHAICARGLELSATNRAEIGSREADFLSCREYGNQGITAVIR